MLELMIYERPSEAVMAGWTEEWIRDVVEKSIRDGILYDDAMNKALFPNGTPQWWGQWPEEARRAWDRGASLYLQLRPIAPRAKRDAVTLERAWTAIETSMKRKDPDARLSWRDIGGNLGISGRAARSMIEPLGFVLEGRNYTRRLIAAPCISCGEVVKLKGMAEGRKCRNCNAAKKTA
jgi:hypothetical protein